VDGIPVAILATQLGDQVLSIDGDSAVVVTRPAALDAPGSAGSIAFCSARGAVAAERIAASTASAVVCAPDAEIVPGEKTLIRVNEPRAAFAQLLRSFFQPAAPPPSVHPSAVVSLDANIDPAATIGPFCSIGPDCHVGPESVLVSHVHLYPHTHIGRGVTIHSGTVIGATGFGYVRRDDGSLESFPHVGGVVIEDDVEIGSNTSIDRGTLGNTVIRRGARIDNLVHIAHNVDIGEDALVIAHAMVGGSTKIGARAFIAPSACLRDVIEIGPGATVGLGAVVTRDVPPGEIVMGAPARAASAFKAELRALQQLAAVEGTTETPGA
jgi:UDP-3-O-[3-hydroxymyristoyl] glucosamine N-acyltransferase